MAANGKTSRALPLIGALTLVAFILGAGRLSLLRLSAGDVYPFYSSLRSDPMGAKALHDSLAQIDGVSVSRNYKDLRKLRQINGTTVLVLGSHWSDFNRIPKTIADELKSITDGGGRLVLSFLPHSFDGEENNKDSADNEAGEDTNFDDENNSREENEEQTETSFDNREEQPNKQKNEQEDQAAADEKDEEIKLISLETLWGFKFTFDGKADSLLAPRADSLESEPTGFDLSEEIKPRTALRLELLDHEWKAARDDDGLVVFAEKTFGQGEIVLSVDSYVFSNEALYRERRTGFLARLLGTNSRIVFDETHLGVIESPGVASLIKKYRLQGFMAGLALIAGLFIWKNSSGFGTSTKGEEAEQFSLTGADASVGLINLLHRNIKEKNLIDVCTKEWKKSLKAMPSHKRARAQKALDILKGDAVAGVTGEEEKLSDNVKKYRAASRVLLSRKVKD